MSNRENVTATISVMGWTVEPGDRLAHTSAPVESVRMENGKVYLTIPFVKGEIVRKMTERIQIHPRHL